MGYKWIEMSNHGFGMNVYWDAPYGSTTAYVYWDLDYNDYGRTFNLYQRSTGTRYNSGSNVPLGEYCIYVYKSGSYATQSEWFTIAADAPPDHFFWYFAGDHGSDPNPNYQIWSHGSTATLLGALPNVAGTTYKVSYNANGGSSTPTASNSTSTYKHTYWNDDYGYNYSPGAKISNVTEGNSFRAVWSESRTAVKLANAITHANGSSTRTVTFNANGGTCSTASLNSTATITYSFGGWKANNAGTILTAGSSYTPSGNVTMYAQWTSSTGAYSAITLPTPTRTGYDFKGWATTSTATSGVTGSYTPSSSLTLYATWAKKTYPVTYYANGHGTAPAAQTKTYDTTLTLQPFIAQNTSTGYKVSYNANGGSSTPATSSATTLTHTQTYWNTNSSGTGTNYASKASYTGNASLNLYAIWSTSGSAVTLASAISRANASETGYTVTFNANGGTCSTPSLTATNTRKYTFSKWAAGSISGTQYSAGASFTPSANTTMYAIWTSSVTNGSITLPTPTRTGYTFKGWSTSSTASSGSTGSYTPTGNVTLYATWQINTWTVSYNANGHGTAPASQTKTYGVNLTVAAYIAQQTGTGYTVSYNKNGGATTPNAQTSTIYYDQISWNTNSSGTGTGYVSRGTYTANSGATLYAIWSPTNGSITLPAAITRASTTENGYKVTFNANGGTCTTTELIATNVRNYAFNKWAAGSASGTGYSAGASYTPSATTTMYATWTETVDRGSINLPTASKSGHSFVGWATSSSATEGVTGGYTPTGNVTLYAIYSANSYPISYNANGYGTAPAGQTKTHGVNLTLQPFIADQIASGYKVSFNANGGSSTPSALTSNTIKSQTYWNTAANGSGTNYASKGTYSANSAVTLYAIWGGTTNQAVTLPAAITRASTVVNHTISYDANGGTSTPASQTNARTTPYTFAGWAEGSASGTKYAPGDNYTPNANKTMYAVWNTGTTTGAIVLNTGISKNDTTANGYTVTFNANGGTCATTNLTATDTIKWTFDKWNTNAAGTGTDYTAGAAYSFNADTKLYAKWTSSIKTRGAINLPTPTRKNYKFMGWATSANATEGVTGSYTPSGNVTLYAIWKMDSSIVHYNNNGADVPCLVYYNNNGTAVLCEVYFNNNGIAVRV